MKTLIDILTVAGIAAAPISELRGAIPIGIHSLRLDPVVVVAAAVFGNMVPAVLIVFFLEPFVRVLGRYIPWLHRFVDIYLVRSRQKVRAQVERYGTIGLLVFIGIPLPMTGAWTGSVGAVLMGLSKKKALIACFGGVIMAAAIVTAIDLGAMSFLGFLLK